MGCTGGGVNIGRGRVNAHGEQHRGPRLHSIPFIQVFMKRKSCAKVLDRSRSVLGFQSQGLKQRWGKVGEV